jgi:hypothetical protein
MRQPPAVAPPPYVPPPARPKKPWAQTAASGWSGCFGLIVVGIIVSVLRNAGFEPLCAHQPCGGSNEGSRPAPVPGLNVEGSRPAPFRELNVEVHVTDTELIVLNRSAERWTNCTLEIHSVIIDRRGQGQLTRWSKGPVTIRPGETVRRGLMSFTTSGGERFNPFTRAVESVFVQCDTPRGRVYWDGTLRGIP